jgi:hypothetical protein
VWKENILTVCENKVLRRIFGHKKKEQAGGWRRLRNKELCNFYTEPNVIRMIKSRRTEWGVYRMDGRHDKYMQHYDQKK